jgi:outer membrane protein TolC
MSNGRLRAEKLTRKLRWGAGPLFLLVLCARISTRGAPTPNIAIGDHYRQAGESVAPPARSSIGDAAWWDFFGDPAHGQLVARAARSNPDIRIGACARWRRRNGIARVARHQGCDLRTRYA